MRTAARRRRAAARVPAAVAVLLALSACDQPGDSPPAGEHFPGDTTLPERAAVDTLPADTADPATARADSVTLVFTRGEEPVTVRRAVQGEPWLRAALEALLRGPTEPERAAGIHSWFSAETAGALRSVAVDDEGRATVDFADLRPLIPNASTSAGSAMLLHQLNGTVFQFGTVRSVEYRLEGSCEAFWEWLQRGGCPVVERGS